MELKVAHLLSRSPASLVLVSSLLVVSVRVLFAQVCDIFAHRIRPIYLGQHRGDLLLSAVVRRVYRLDSGPVFGQVLRSRRRLD